MIDFRTEQLLKLAVAARSIPSSRGDRPVAPSTLWRWHHRGVLVAGRRVYLDALRLPSGTVTSLGAIQAFLVALSATNTDEPLVPVSDLRKGEAIKELDKDLFPITEVQGASHGEK